MFREEKPSVSAASLSGEYRVVFARALYQLVPPTYNDHD